MEASFVDLACHTSNAFSILLYERDENSCSPYRYIVTIALSCFNVPTDPYFVV